MIRFLLDFQTTSIIIIADKFIQKVGFYHVADFLEIEKNGNTEYKLSVRAIFNDLLNYWKLLLSEETNELFLIYDLSDQYISAFHLEKFNFKGLDYFKITRKFTQELAGWAITKKTSLSALKNKKWETDSDYSWQVDRRVILRGIDWSLENLRINTNPISL